MSWGLWPQIEAVEFNQCPPSFPIPAPSLPPGWTQMPCRRGPTGQVMGQGGSEPGPCRDEIIPQDGEGTHAGPGHMHSDVTRGFSSQWKHGVHFTVRAAQSLFLADLAAALPLLFPASVHSSQGALCFHHSAPHPHPHSTAVFLCQACPSCHL